MGYWCATEVDEKQKFKTFAYCKPHPHPHSKKNSKVNAGKANVNSKKNNRGKKPQERLTVKYFYKKKTNEKVEPGDAKEGKCLFPFKTLKKGPDINTCIKSGDKKTSEGTEWCATKHKSDNILKAEWGYCVPPKMTREEYGKLF